MKKLTSVVAIVVVAAALLAFGMGLLAQAEGYTRVAGCDTWAGDKPAQVVVKGQYASNGMPTVSKIVLSYRESGYTQAEIDGACK